MSRVNLGDECKDRATGFKGIAVVRCEYLSGCTRIGLQPQVDKDGKLSQAEHFDEPMIDVIEAGKVNGITTDNGGPQPAPRQHAAPPR